MGKKATFYSTKTSFNMFHIFNIWQNIKAYLPGACGDRTELDHFAKHGHNKTDTELSSFRHTDEGGEDGEHKIAGTEDYDSDWQPNGPVGGEGGFEGEFGGKGSEINEWQAGWNVTNAIQVSRLVICLLSDIKLQ